MFQEYDNTAELLVSSLSINPLEDDELDTGKTYSFVHVRNSFELFDARSVSPEWNSVLSFHFHEYWQ